MTQVELKSIIVRLKCCSAEQAYTLSINLTNGDTSCKSKIDNVLLLNDYIDLLLKYDLSEGAINCLTSDEFENILNNAKTICKLCDCE